MKWMKVLHGGFNAAHVFLTKRTANIEVKSGQRRAMINHADATDDNEFQAAVFES